MLEIGTIFENRYKLLAPLGHGGFASAFLAEDIRSNEKVVIKMYDVVGPLGFGVRRATYLIDQARRIRSAVLADFRIGMHEDFVRKAIALSAAT